MDEYEHLRGCASVPFHLALDRGFWANDSHLSFVWIGGCPKVLHHYRNMAKEHQIAVQIEESQTPAKLANDPTPLHFGDKCEAVVVQEDGCPYNQHYERESRTRHHEMDRA